MLKIEWLKLRKYRPFWVLMGLYPLSLFGVLLLTMRFYDWAASKGTQAQLPMATNPFAFPSVWHTSTYVASFFHVIPCVLILLNVCNEFQFRTHRQNLLDGWSRLQFFGAKGAVTGLLTLICFAWVALAALGAGLLNGGALSLEGTEYLGYFLVQCLVYNGLALVLGFGFRRGLVSLAIFLIYSNFLEKIIFGLIGTQWRQAAYFGPLTVANQLVPFPIWQSAVRQLTPDAPATATLMSVAGIYLALFLGVSWLSFGRDDL